MASKGNAGAQLLLIIVGIVVVIVAALPKEVWILLGIGGVIWLTVAVVKKQRSDNQAPSEPITDTNHAPVIASASSIRTETGMGAIMKSEQSSRNDSSAAANADEERSASEVQEQLSGLVREGLKIRVTISTRASDTPVTVGTTSGGGSYSIPNSAPRRTPDAKWIRAGESVSIQGKIISGGMMYVGSWLPAGNNENDPCLINPRLSIAASRTRADSMGYWPSYTRILEAARSQYLNWLAEGRKERGIDIGYVFLFFYGLERRVLVDASGDDESRSELATIATEIERLLTLYGAESYSFQRYAFGLLDVIRSASAGDKLYAQPIPDLPETYELPHYLKLALGQASRDKAPVPANLALAWAQRQPGIYFRTAAQRCATEFDQLFRIRYQEKYGDGMILPQNRTKLKCLYQPASSGFRGQAELRLPSNDLPDLTAVSGPIDALAELVKQTTEELDPYSRLLGKSPDAKETAAARMLLPLPLWPEAGAQRFEELLNKVRVSLVEMKLSALLITLDLAIATERKVLLQLTKHLDSKGIAMEPDIEAGARTPKPEDHVVLFVKPTTVGSDPDQVHYRTAQLTLQLSAMVAMADGEFNEPEQRFIEQQIADWEGLTDADRTRLHAHMRLMVIELVTMVSLKKKI
ncbi:MAG: TerB N-terminal domain-containing protein [Flavobacteriales bacterium]|nr:TerB N-terminal domain-containing protein [Flavobacteriales bacterium]